VLEGVIEYIDGVIEETKKELAELGVEIEEQEFANNQLIFESSKFSFEKGSSLKLHSSPEKAMQAKQ